MSEQPAQRPQPQMIDRGEFEYDRRDPSYEIWARLGRYFQKYQREMEIRKMVEVEIAKSELKEK